MRIHRIHLQHVAGVDDRELRFGDGVTVVVGPNEAGKSTIPTALQLLLDKKDRHNNADIRAVRPVHVDEDPTIELECSTGPYHVTYRKVFGATASRRETVLTVHAPQPRSLTGDAAHERMREILDETVDEQLWSALRVQQRHDVGQADLTESGALAAALDAAGAGASTLSDDGPLVARVEDAAAEFWTETGKQRAPLTAADQAVTEADERLRSATASLSAVHDATRRHDELVGRLDVWRASLPRLETRAKETAEALSAVTEHRAAARAAAARVESAEAALTRARDAVGDRELLASRVARLSEVAVGLDEDVARARAAGDEAEDRVADARAARDEARALLDSAGTTLRAATVDVRLLRRAADVDQLEARIEQAAEVHDRRESAKARLDDGAPTAAVIRRLDALDERVRTTKAVMEAGLPRILVSGPTRPGVSIDDVAVSLRDGGVERRVGAETAVTVDDVTILVSPGTSAAELADAHGDAVHALRTALAEAGVADVGAARARRDTAQEARRELDQTEAEWARLQQVDGLDGLRASLVRTREQLASLRSERPGDRPMPDDLTHAEAGVAAAEAEVQRCQAAAATASTLLEAASDSAATARTATAEAVARRAGARDQLTEAIDRLTAARGSAPDEALGEAVAAADLAVTDARNAAASARAALVGIDVGTVEADADAAKARLDATRRQIRQAEVESAELWGSIESRSEAGLGEKVPQMEAALADAEASRDAVRRQADALLLLRQTLRRHREDAIVRYQSPLRHEIERLGRIVFGDGFSVELDETLRVVRRNLDDRTLEVEQLSGGAQEQLAIITRLAAASLVDEGQGVPLILDDALGYADPARTDRMATLLADVGRDAQVIVLTCHPDRFTAVPDARTLTIASQ